MIHKINGVAGRSAIVEQSKLNVGMVLVEIRYSSGDSDACIALSPHEAVIFAQALEIEAQTALAAGLMAELAVTK